MAWRTAITLALLAAMMLVTATGCQSVPRFSELPTPAETLHDLKPHRLWRLNRGPGMSSEAYFSVSDPLPAAKRAESGEPSAESRK